MAKQKISKCVLSAINDATEKSHQRINALKSGIDLTRKLKSILENGILEITCTNHAAIQDTGCGQTPTKNILTQPNCKRLFPAKRKNDEDKELIFESLMKIV